MKINRELVEKVAKIARLELTEVEVAKFTKDFREILTAFSKLNKINTSEVKASLQPVEIKEIYREDVTNRSLDQAEALSNSKSISKGYFRGPSST